VRLNRQGFSTQFLATVLGGTPERFEFCSAR